MPRSRTSWLVAAVTALAVASPASAQPFTSLTFFGDSFTDTGNGDILALAAFGKDITPTPPYAPGRASNGLLWADYLAAAFGQPTNAGPSLLGGRNYAIGTARTGLTGLGGAPVGMLAQLAMYPAGPTDPTGLYALWGGANDVFDAALLGSTSAQLMALSTAVDNLGTIAGALYARGARSFLIPNVPNVGLAPIAAGTPAAPLLGALSSQFNTLLAAKLTTLSMSLPGSTFYGLKLDNLFANILADAANGGSMYGLTNTTVPCLPPPFGAGVSCATAVFADVEHPTTAVHQLIAQAAYDRIVNGHDVSAVPEPATLALVAGGLGVLGVIVRRKRAA